MQNGQLNVPDNPILPFIEGDGTGPDIWAASQRVIDAAVEKAYGSGKKIAWYEVYAGEKANDMYGEQIWLPDETVDAFAEYLIGIKGPLTTPVGGGIRSLNVALRQRLDLYVCLRPVRWFEGVPSPVVRPGEVDMVIFREISTPASNLLGEAKMLQKYSPSSKKPFQIGQRKFVLARKRKSAGGTNSYKASGCPPANRRWRLVSG